MTKVHLQQVGNTTKSKRMSLSDVKMRGGSPVCERLREHKVQQFKNNVLSVLATSSLNSFCGLAVKPVWKGTGRPAQSIGQ